MIPVRTLPGVALRTLLNALRPLGTLAVFLVREARETSGNKVKQKALTRALLRANALNGSLVAVMMPLYGDRFNAVWRVVVGVTLLSIVLERALFEWLVPKPADKKPGRDWPTIPIFLEEGPIEPINLNRYTGRGAALDREPVRFTMTVTEVDGEPGDRGGAS